jgi:hypothetical protein
VEKASLSAAPGIGELEAMIAQAEKSAPRPTSMDAGQHQALRESVERASAIIVEALQIADEDRSKLDHLFDEHEADVRRLAEDSKRMAIGGSADGSQRLEALVETEREALHALPDDWRNPWVPSWPPVYFIRTTPGALLGETHIEDAKSWAKWRCATPALSSGTEKLSFFHLWQNTEDFLVVADISVRLNLTGHMDCSAEGWGIPAGWFNESRSEADLSAHLTVWPVWLAHDPLQQPQYSLPVASLDVTAGVFSQSTQTAINESLLVRTYRFAVPAQAFILIEASVKLDHLSSADVDFTSGDFRVGCPYCFVTVPVPQMTMNP